MICTLEDHTVKFCRFECLFHFHYVGVVKLGTNFHFVYNSLSVKFVFFFFLLNKLYCIKSTILVTSSQIYFTKTTNSKTIANLIIEFVLWVINLEVVASWLSLIVKVIELIVDFLQTNFFTIYFSFPFKKALEQQTFLNLPMHYWD